MNETRRNPTTGRQSPSLFDKWHGIFYMPSRIDEAGHTKAFDDPVAEHWRESQRSKRSLVGLEPTSAHTYESEIQRSTTYATPTSPPEICNVSQLGLVVLHQTSVTVSVSEPIIAMIINTILSIPINMYRFFHVLSSTRFRHRRIQCHIRHSWCIISPGRKDLHNDTGSRSNITIK